MNVLDFQSDSFVSKVTSIPEVGPLPTPFLRLKVPAGNMPRALHFGVSLVNINYVTGATVSLRFKSNGTNVGEMRFRFAQDGTQGRFGHNVSPPCVTYVNRVDDGSPDDLASMVGIGPLPADALRWDIVTDDGTVGLCVTSPIHFLADIDEVEMQANEPGSWGISVLANNNVVNPLYAYAYFFLGVISNALK